MNGKEHNYKQIFWAKIYIKYLKVAFDQAFLKYAGNLVTSAKFLNFGIKCDISEPDYPIVGNTFFN